MSRWGQLVVGIVLVLLGILWTLQGLDLLGQTGGMNGQGIWAVIGVVVAIGGAALLWRTRSRAAGGTRIDR